MSADRYLLVIRTFAALITVVSLGACSSRGDVFEGSDSEAYKGPQSAAIAPVWDQRPSSEPANARLQADVQRSIQRQLDHSGIFAGVVALDRPDDGNEAEVIIEPALIPATRYGTDNNIDLQIRVREKTKRRVVLDKHYQGGSQADALNVAISELEKDLEDTYNR